MEDGSERPVTYTSHTPSTAERNYGHVDKEALAVVFAVKKFQQFPMVAILRFTQLTNHFWGFYNLNGLKQDAKVGIDFASL